MKRRSPSFFIKQKRTLLIAGGVAMLLLVLVASAIKHTQITSKVEQAYNAAKASAKLISPTSNASRTKRFAAIKQLSQPQTIESCNGEWWNAWYSAFPSVQEQTKTCNSKLEQLDVISDAAKHLTAYLKDDDKVAKTLAILRPATGSDNWQKVALSSAESALRDIEAIAVTADNKALLSVSKQKVLTIITTWSALNQASAKEDKAAYQQAETNVIQAYADLGAITDISDEQVDTLVGNLQATARKL